MSDSRKCKTISFDLTDGFEIELLSHAEKHGKFSKYIKRLIQRDLEGWGNLVSSPVIPVETEPYKEDIDAMVSFF